MKPLLLFPAVLVMVLPGIGGRCLADEGPVYINGPVYIIPATPPPPTQPQAPTSPTPALHYRLGLGLHGGAIWTSQELYSANLLMPGVGARARLRLLPSFALDLTFDAVNTSLRDGSFVRQSYPLLLGALFYLLPDRPGIHFNVHGLIGGGILPSRITLAQGTPAEQSASTLELAGQLGTGFELRFWRLAVTADARGLLLWRATTSTGATDTVPGRSYGWSLDGGLLFWL